MFVIALGLSMTKILPTGLAISGHFGISEAQSDLKLTGTD